MDMIDRPSGIKQMMANKRAHRNTCGATCSASVIGKCSVCHGTMMQTALYYVGGENEDEPLCGACMCDALLALRTKMQNAKVDAPSGARSAE